MENPYQVNSSKSHLDTDAKLTRRVLKIYKKYQGRDMPMLDLLGMHAMSWLVFALVILPLMLFWIWLLRNGNLATVPMVGFVLGVLFGLVVRDVRHCRSTARLWPIVDELLNWERIDSKLEELGPK